jgi:hypothetical protein
MRPSPSPGGSCAAPCPEVYEHVSGVKVFASEWQVIRLDDMEVHVRRRCYPGHAYSIPPISGPLIRGGSC